MGSATGSSSGWGARAGLGIIRVGSSTLTSPVSLSSSSSSKPAPSSLWRRKRAKKPGCCSGSSSGMTATLSLKNFWNSASNCIVSLMVPVSCCIASGEGAAGPVTVCCT